MSQGTPLTRVQSDNEVGRNKNGEKDADFRHLRRTNSQTV